MENKQWAEEFLEKIRKKLEYTVDKIEVDYPYTTQNGKYSNVNMPPFSWTCGFFGGMMWHMYILTKEEKFKKRAVKCSERLETALHDHDSFYCLDNHDLGFVFVPTNVAHYKILGDEKAKIRSIHAANMLAGRFNLNGRFIRAWRNGIMREDNTGCVIIDCLMNLPLLYWAGETYPDPRYKAIAVAHADTVMKTFFREDGSLRHIILFNPETGEVESYPRGQAYSADSAWTRGAAWGIYGFFLSYKHTKEKKYLNASEKAAAYFIEMMGKSKIPPIDFKQPEKPDYIDTTAGAVAACAFIELYKETGLKKYIKKAEEMLRELEKQCNFNREEESILQHGAEAYYSKNKVVPIHDLPIIYGDYFLIEALMKFVEKDIDFWG